MAPNPSLSISAVACSLHSCPDIPKSISDDPRIQALLKCNGPLLETDRVSLLATASESSNLLLVLREKIDHTQRTLDGLLDGQAKVEPDSLDPCKPPWTLSQVCCSWRRVSLSAASLWRCISIDFERYREPRDVHLHQFMLGLHLQRARQSQLTIRLSSVKDVSSHAFIPILLTSIPCWKHLRTCIPAKSLAVFSTYGSYLESLYYLQIALPGDGTASAIHTFEMAQSLHVLDIDSVLCPYIYLPDGGKVLTRLVIQGPLVNHTFSFLRKMSHIQELELCLMASKSFERISSPVMMPNLSSMTIYEWEGAALSSFARLFESLELPTLSYLQAVLDNKDNNDTGFVFPEILPHHYCRGITTLVAIVTRKVGNPGLINFLTQVSNLLHLIISTEIVDNDLLSALTRSKNNKDNILPELRTFDLRGSQLNFEHGLLSQVVESRRKDEGEDDKGDHKEDNSDEGDNDDDDDEEEDEEAEDETEGDQEDDEGDKEDNEGEDEGDSEGDNKDDDREEEGVMLEKVCLDAPLTFDDPSLASRWQALQRNGLIVKYDY
ncbi:hypothetical protein F5146DRAFT_1218685 [Armillaria mellea]|nr:hypothetical protein F5146DRAFT_1218685 [Armillaria mellea]